METQLLPQQRINIKTSLRKASRVAVGSASPECNTSNNYHRKSYSAWEDLKNQTLVKFELQAEEKPSFSLTATFSPGDTDSCYVARVKVLAILLNTFRRFLS